MKLDKGPIPRYYQLGQILRKSIINKEVLAGELLPTELELCEQFGVSRSTVRQAFAELEKDNLVSREQGRGTFVIYEELDPFNYKVPGSLDEMLVGVGTSKLKVLSKNLVAPDNEVLEDMNLAVGTRVYLFEALRYVETEKVTRRGLLRAYIPEQYGKKITIKSAEAQRFLFQLVEKEAGELANKVRQVVSAAGATSQVAEKIKVEEGHPLLKTKRIYFSRSGKVLECAINYSPAEILSYTTDLHRNGGR